MSDNKYKKYLHKADILLHIPLTISDGLKVGSSTTSTISAPRGSSSTSWLTALSGGGGGGGGGDPSIGTDVTLFRSLEFVMLVVVVLTGREWREANFVFSGSSSEVKGEDPEDRPDSWNLKGNIKHY